MVYSIRLGISSWAVNVRKPIRCCSGKTQIWIVWILSVVLLISAGIAYRVPARQIRRLGQEPIPLPVPLSEFPLKLGDWTGREVEVRSTTKEYMTDNFADDFFSRQYSSPAKGWVDVYVVYCSRRPGGILGHRPGVCYPAYGWQPEGTEKIQLTTAKGRKIDCLLHHFYKAPPEYDRMVVLSFYVVSGRVTASERDFSGPLGRRPNIARDPTRYVAQVQISSTVQKSAEAVLEDMADEILEFLPAAADEDVSGKSVESAAGDAKKGDG